MLLSNTFLHIYLHTFCSLRLSWGFQWGNSNVQRSERNEEHLPTKSKWGIIFSLNAQQLFPPNTLGSYLCLCGTAESIFLLVCSKGLFMLWSVSCSLLVYIYRTANCSSCYAPIVDFVLRHKDIDKGRSFKVFQALKHEHTVSLYSSIEKAIARCLANGAGLWGFWLYNVAKQQVSFSSWIICEIVDSWKIE